MCNLIGEQFLSNNGTVKLRDTYLLRMWTYIDLGILQTILQIVTSFAHRLS